MRHLPETIEFIGGGGARGHDEEPLNVTGLLAYEFRQSLRFQVWRRGASPREGVALGDAQAALNQFDADLANGIAVLAPYHIQDVFRGANELSTRHTKAYETTQRTTPWVDSFKV